MKQNPLSSPTTNSLQRGCCKGLTIKIIAMLLDQANGSTRVMFLGLGVDAPPCSRPSFILARKVRAKLCFCILCLWTGLSTFQEFVCGKCMFSCLHISRKQACGHPPSLRPLHYLSRLPLKFKTLRPTAS